MGNELAGIGAVEVKLTALMTQLADATTLPDLDNIQRQAEALRSTAKLARFGLLYQNKFWAVRIRAMRQFGVVWYMTPKNKGGRPDLVGQDQPPTLAELNIHEKFAERCLRLAREVAEQDIDTYIARGEGDDPITLTLAGKDGLFEHAGWEENRRDFARQWEESRNRVIKEAQDNAAVPPQLDPEPPPKIDPELLREPPPNVPPVSEKGRAATIRAALRTAVDPSANQHEAANALNTVRRLDPRLETLDNDRGFHLTQRLAKANNDLYDRVLGLQEHINKAGFEKRIQQLEARERKHRKVIVDLTAERDKLRAENTELKAELALVQATPAPTPKESTVH